MIPSVQNKSRYLSARLWQIVWSAEEALLIIHSRFHSVLTFQVFNGLKSQSSFLPCSRSSRTLLPSFASVWFVRYHALIPTRKIFFYSGVSPGRYRSSRIAHFKKVHMGEQKIIPNVDSKFAAGNFQLS